MNIPNTLWVYGITKGKIIQIYASVFPLEHSTKYYSENLIADIKKKIYEQGKDGNVDDIWMGINSALAKAIFIIDEVLKDE